VCARLAMGLMIKDCKLVQGSDKSGRGPNFWMEKATEMFSYGFCRPEKGDIGEVACALYLLFCGDKIRYDTDKQLKQFSVPLDKWLSVLRNPLQDVPPETDGTASVSCVQVCRNYLRHTLGQLMHLLPHWYRSGRAIYAHDNCPAYDIVIPIRYRKKRAQQEHGLETLYDYCPMLVSVKNQKYVSPAAKKTFEDDMVAVLDSENIKTGLCMLILAGLTNDQMVLPETGNRMDIDFQEGCISCFTVIIKSDDPFGVSRFLEMASMRGGEQAEIYVSHSEVLSTPRVIPTNNLLRPKGSSQARHSLDRLRDRFEAGKKKPEEKTEEKTEESSPPKRRKKRKKKVKS